MHNHPVHWSDGLYLVPQHFQAADRHWTELIQESEGLDHEYNYGLRSIEFNRDEISNAHFQVYSCRARTRDGTILSLERGQAPDRIALAAETAAPKKGDWNLSLEGAQAVSTVYLAVPRWRTDMGNVLADATRDGDASLYRFREWRVEQPDETSGTSYWEVNLKVLQPRLVLVGKDESLPNFESLPIARVRPIGEAGPELDDTYIPPLLAIDAWPPLAEGIIRYIYNRVGSKIQVYSDFVKSQGISWGAADATAAEQFMWLANLCEASTALSAIVFARGVHPFTAYRELCRIVGRLSIFDVTRRPPEDLPRYDHDNLGPIFRWFKSRIDALLDTESPRVRYESRVFRGRGLGMQVAIDSRWVESGWDWYVGVYHPTISDDLCHRLLEEDTLLWKLASQIDVDRIFETRNPGLELKPLGQQTPVALPLKTGMSYYDVSRKPKSIWDNVVTSKTLAMRFRDKHVENKDVLEGSERLVLVHQGKRVELQFALYAVPPIA